MADHILVVDDEPDFEHFILLAFKKEIQDDHYRFSFARNGKQALDTLQKNADISLVLTDINMPEMDGFSLLNEIKALNTSVKSVVISAYGDLTNIRAAMNHGAFDFLTKPINISDLKITVEKTLKEILLLKQALRGREQYIALKKELDIAQQLQMSMMPKLPAKVGKFDLDGEIRLSSKVGGDFLDLIELGSGEVLMVLGDCSGHGLSSALIMSAICHSLRTLATQISDYRDFIPSLNQIVYSEFSRKFRYATMVFVHIQKENPIVRILRAGHEMPVLKRNGSFQPPDWRGGLPIGIFPKRTEDQWVEMEFEAGDELFLYTDGVIDGLPDEHRSMKDLLTDPMDVAAILKNRSFFHILQTRYGWRSMDDATLLKMHWNG